MKFLNPIPNGKMDSSMFSNTVEFVSYNSDTILSPEEGVVVSSDKFKCGGNIKIEHFIEGKTFYSEFCGVDRLMSFRGQQVRRGDILGTIGDSPIKYTIFNSNGSKENVRDFITGAGLTAGIYSKDTKTDDISTDETQDDTKPNKEKVSDKETKKTNSKILSKEKRRREPSYYEKTGTIPNPFIDALILPFHALDAIRMKENIESDEVLKEEISDIKRLIKY